jgi:hypothetical protein
MSKAQELATVESIVIAGGIESIGGPQSIDLKVDIGEEGIRGSYFYPGFGLPEDFNFQVLYPEGSDQFGQRVYKDPKRFDWYLNVRPGDETYLSIFQQQNPKDSTKWDRIFKLIPNVYKKSYGGTSNRNPKLSFNSQGKAIATFSVSNVELPLQERFTGGYGVPDNAIEVSSISEMIELEDSDFEALNGIDGYVPSNANPAYVFVKDRCAFFKTTSVSHSTINDWDVHALFSIEVDVENTQPVTSTFELSMPTFTKNINNPELGTYTFVLKIYTTVIHYATGEWSPLSGSHSTHISLSVI